MSIRKSFVLFCSVLTLFSCGSSKRDPNLYVVAINSRDYVIKGDKLLTQIGVTSKELNYLDSLVITVEYNHYEYTSESQILRRYIDFGEHMDYEYSFDIPTDYEPGHWSIKLQLMNAQFTYLTCTETYFDLEE